MNELVKSSVRTLELLELFAAVQEPLGVSDVARRLEMPKSSTQALLTTLVARGYLSKDILGYFLPEKLKESYRGIFIRTPLVLQLLVIIVVAVLLFQMRSTEVMPFIYFRF